MAVELKLSKFDSTPWGFRLVGGADFDTPLTVIKVTEGSIAEEAGMRLGDTVVRVNDVPTAPLSHAQAHELIKLSGNNFTLGVFRGVVGETIPEPKPLAAVAPDATPGATESVISQPQEVKEEVPVPGETPVLEIAIPPGETLPEDVEIEEIQRSFEKQETQDLKEFAQRFEQTIEQKTEQKMEKKIEAKHTESKSQLSVAPPQTGRSPSPARAVRLEYSVKIEKNEKKQEEVIDTKWSSFLQKPKGAKPIPKEEMIKPKDPPYKVIISKIKRRLSKDWVEDNDKGLTAKADVATSEEEYKKEEIESKEKEETSQEIQETQEQQIQEENTLAVSEISESETNVSSQQQVATESTNIVAQTQQISQTSMLQMQQLLQTTQTSEYISETDLSMEEQLLRVQKQLLALSQLPAAIQQTLNAVTDQLSKIVKTDEQDANQDQNGNNNNQDEEKSGHENENTDGENNPGEEGGDREGGATEGEDNIPKIVEETDANLETETTPGNTPIPPTPSPEPIDNLTKEEREKQDKKFKTAVQKEEERQMLEDRQLKLSYKKPSFPSAPLQRPIVLPGGKKWHEPDDVIPRKINARKYTDEVIAETISSQSEIIIGTTLGESNCPLVPSKAVENKRINFLKYKPEPPKNLDHLKHSEVYKMVHSLDLPTRGIAGRPSLVLAEEDLRSQLQDKSEENVSIQTPPNLPAQMEP